MANPSNQAVKKSNRTSVEITVLDTEKVNIATVLAILPQDYHFSVNNDYEPLLNSQGIIGELIKGTEYLKSANSWLPQDISLVPFSPMIWMGSKPLQVEGLDLQFVAHTSAKEDVHDPLHRLLAMSLPSKGYTAKGFFGSLGPEGIGMLHRPPALKVRIGNVIEWSPCYIESIIISEKAPYSKEGYGMTGSAKVTFIRRDYVFAEAFSNDINAAGTNAKEIATTVVTAPNKNLK